MKPSTLKTTLLISLLASMVAITGCEEKGPMEKAAQGVDNAVDESRDAIEDSADDMEDAADDAADAVKDATN